MNHLRVMPCIYLRVINSLKSYITFVLCRFRLCILQNSSTLEYSWSRQAAKVSYFFFSLEKILKALTHSFSWVAVFFFFRHNFFTVLAKIMSIFLFPSEILNFGQNMMLVFSSVIHRFGKNMGIDNLEK